MRTLRKGDKGESVRFLQERLNRHGYGPLATDGDFGNGTQRVVIQFQAANDLAADGIVGPRTWDLLYVESRVAVPESVREDLIVDLMLPSGLEGSIQRALEAAIDDIGQREIPDGSNGGPEISHLVSGYAEFWGGTAGTHYPWCAIAVCAWTANGLGLGVNASEVDWTQHPFGKWLGGVAWIERWARQEGRWSSDLSEVPPGAIFLMSRGGSSSDAAAQAGNGHCGLVLEDNGTTLTTIDGNVGNRVQKRERDTDTMRGWVRWW